MPRTGRPKIHSEPVTVRVPADLLEQIDNLRRVEQDVPNRPEMIRRLVIKGIEQKSVKE